MPRCRPRRPTGDVEAVTGDVTVAVTAVTRPVTPALDMTGTVPAVTTVAGGLPRSPRADGPLNSLKSVLVLIER